MPTLTLSGTDASDFTLTLADDNGNGTYELAFKAVPNYEAPADAGRNNVYNINGGDGHGQRRADGHDGRRCHRHQRDEEDGTVTLNTSSPGSALG